jgi:hypothetical protein
VRYILSNPRSCQNPVITCYSEKCLNNKCSNVCWKYNLQVLVVTVWTVYDQNNWLGPYWQMSLVNNVWLLDKRRWCEIENGCFLDGNIILTLLLRRVTLCICQTWQNNDIILRLYYVATNVQSYREHIVWYWKDIILLVTLYKTQCV